MRYNNCASLSPSSVSLYTELGRGFKPVIGSYAIDWRHVEQMYFDLDSDWCMGRSGGKMEEWMTTFWGAGAGCCGRSALVMVAGFEGRIWVIGPEICSRVDSLFRSSRHVTSAHAHLPMVHELNDDVATLEFHMQLICCHIRPAGVSVHLGKDGIGKLVRVGQWERKWSTLLEL